MRERLNKIKMQLEVKWFLAIFIVMLVTLLILSRVVSIALTKLYQIAAESSSDNVAIQLTSLMSGSGAVTGEIEINYVLSKDVLYDIEVDSNGKEVNVMAKFAPIYIQKSSSEAKFCTNFSSQKFQDVNRLVIEKKEENGKFYYKVYAWRHENEE